MLSSTSKKCLFLNSDLLLRGVFRELVELCPFASFLISLNILGGIGIRLGYSQGGSSRSTGTKLLPCGNSLFRILAGN